MSALCLVVLLASCAPEPELSFTHCDKLAKVADRSFGRAKASGFTDVRAMHEYVEREKRANLCAQKWLDQLIQRNARNRG